MFNPIQFYTDGEDKFGERIVGTTTSAVTNYLGSCLAPNGNIYTIPQQASQVLKWTQNVGSSIGTYTPIGTVYSAVPNTYRWAGAVLAPNGFIYAAPYNAYQVLKINPTADTTTLVGTSNTASGKYVGCILAPNGKIYFVPNTSTQWMVLNPANDSTSIFGPTITGTTALKYQGAVLANDGNIYCIPSANNRILMLNPNTSATTYVGGGLSGTANNYRFVGGTLHPNGKIYMVPGISTRVLEFNPATSAHTYIGGGLGTGLYKWDGAVLAPNGFIYCAPEYETQVLQINPTTSAVTRVGPAIPPAGFDKCATGQLREDGKIYFTAESYLYMIRVTGVLTPNVVGSGITIPSDLSKLATSDYNKYYNKY